MIKLQRLFVVSDSMTLLKSCTASHRGLCDIANAISDLASTSRALFSECWKVRIDALHDRIAKMNGNDDLLRRLGKSIITSSLDLATYRRTSSACRSDSKR